MIIGKLIKIIILMTIIYTPFSHFELVCSELIIENVRIHQSALITN